MSSVFEKKWGILIKKESGSLDFTGLKIPREYFKVMEDKIMEKTVIPVVFAINDNYVPYWGVAATSLIEHASREYMYKVYIFYTELSEYNIRRVEGLSTVNVEIKCMDVSNDIPEVELKNKNHVSKETLYRFMAPILLSQYEKILYLDSDIVILRDLAELYQIDIGDNIIGATEEAHTGWLLNYLNERNITPKGYFNTGVLVLNTKKLLDEDILGKVVKVLDTDIVYNYPDQDALNIVLKGNIYYLPRRWNVEWHKMHKINTVSKTFLDDVKESGLNPYIVHYTSDNKAWHSPGLELAEKFWEYAKRTSFYEEIIYKNMPKETQVTKEALPNLFGRFIFPWKVIEADSRIIIYGAGVVGKIYLKQIEQTGYCKVLAVADKRKEQVKDLNTIVILPDEIKEFKYDKILIAIENEKIVQEIIGELVDKECDESKIVWMSPLKKM